MRSSDLRRRVVFQARATARDEYGQRSNDWTDCLRGEAGAPKAITSVATGATTTLGCAAHGFEQGQLVAIAGIAGFTGLPCTFGVLAPTANAFSIAFDSSGISLVLATATATPVTGVPASIEPLRPMEMQAANAMQASLSHRLTVRYHSLLTDPLQIAGMRAVHVHGAVTRIFTLGPGANVDSMNRWITIMASEGPAIV